MSMNKRVILEKLEALRERPGVKFSDHPEPTRGLKGPAEGHRCSRQIRSAYHGQSVVEALFAHLKNPDHVAIRPQRHWTDQKIHVHVFTCILGFLLANLLHLRARRANSPYASIESLLDALTQVRRTMIVRRSAARSGKRAERVTYQLEEIEPDIAPLLPLLGIPG